MSADAEHARAFAVLEENLRLLTGGELARNRVVAGRSRAHRIALSWPSGASPEVCVQLLGMGPHASDPLGWLPGEARGLAEALDLRHGADRWQRGSGPAHHLVLLDPAGSGRDSAELNQRCAALEANYLDGAGWLRLHARGRFAEGSFGRVLERAAADVRRLSAPDRRVRPGDSGFC